MRYMFLRYPGGLKKAVTLSYDDGCDEDMRFSDVITAAGLKCTFNLNGGQIHTSLSKEQVAKYFLERGHEIAVHGEFHRAPGKVRPLMGMQDVINCRLELEKTYGFIIRGMAYPDSGITVMANGNSYERIRGYLENAEIAYCRTLGGDNDKFELPSDWYAWMPTAHHANPKLMEYIDKFLSLDIDSLYIAARTPKLFYMWGHSFEFEHGNNWHLLDEICAKLGGHEDIWYATNMEIYEYITAYNSLEYSADASIIRNPTLKDIYFDIDGTPHMIKSGETLKI